MQTSGRLHEKNHSDCQKRTVTTTRKEQNRVAQKAYRERLKQARKNAVKKHVGGERRLRELRPSQTSVDVSPVTSSISAPGCSYQQSSDFAIAGSESSESLATSTDTFSSLVEAQYSLRSVLDQLVESTLYSDPEIAPESLDTEVPVAASPLPLIPDPSLSASVCLENSFPEVWSDMETVSLPMAISHPNGIQKPSKELKTLVNSAINLQFTPTALLTAILDNALILRLDMTKLYATNYVSPFYRPVSPQDDLKALLAGVSHPWIPAHLQPTLAQVIYPHHPFLDLLPFPLMRERVITMWALMPHVFSLSDFKNDIINGALVCWTSNSNRQPWDMRSWEAAPWFLKKWRMLTEGENDEIWKQSRWWWNMRGLMYEAEF